jgi:hypothetical protein
VQTIDPIAWASKITDVMGAPCLLICTSEDGKDGWDKVRSLWQQSSFLGLLDPGVHLFSSRVGTYGTDLTEDEGWAIAQAVGKTREEFQSKFDGTPGSITLDLRAMAERYNSLKNDSHPDMLVSTVLDAAKLLDKGGMPRLKVAMMRAAAEKIIVGGSIRNQVWNTSLERVDQEGFGRVSEDGQFQIYHPYLEKCVAYEPKAPDVEGLVPIFKERKDYEGLHFLGTRLTLEYHSQSAGADALNVAQESGVPAPFGTLNFAIASIMRSALQPAMEQQIRDVIAGGNKEAYGDLGNYLANRPGREKEAEQAYREAIKAGVDVRMNFANFLATQPGSEAEAEQLYRDEIKDTEEEFPLSLLRSGEASAVPVRA